MKIRANFLSGFDSIQSGTSAFFSGIFDKLIGKIESESIKHIYDQDSNVSTDSSEEYLRVIDQYPTNQQIYYPQYQVSSTSHFENESTGTSIDDSLKGKSGSDFQSDLFYGGDGDDELVGYRGADSLSGGNGNDTIRGGNGRDTLYGGSGVDTLYGGFGFNTFESQKDGSSDKLYLKSDHLAYNWIYEKAGNNDSGEKADRIYELDKSDQIIIQGATDDQIVVAAGASHTTPLGEQLYGVGIFVEGKIEAIYTGGTLDAIWLDLMTSGST